jgi:UDP-N-acetyl-D-mannosaminuronic acid dehydrogenase
VNDGKISYVVEQASRLIDAHAGRVAVLGLAFKANVDDFRESPALKVAVDLAKRFGDRIAIVEPYTEALPPIFDGTGAMLTDIDAALLDCPVMIVLVDHDIFKSVPPEEREGKIVYDTRGIWSH